jgi:capsular polysaccharide biosynthesis protein
MPIYRVREQPALIELAARRGWLESAPPCGVTQLLPPVAVSDVSQTVRQLPVADVAHQDSAWIKLPEATVHGRNFSLIVEDCIFPGGLTHSFAPSPHWQAADRGRVSYEPRTKGLPAVDGAALLGLVGHWGHFFVDALDRLLALEASGVQPSSLLVGDPDLFGLAPQVDACFAVPQVSDLIRALGMAWPPAAPLLAVPKDGDLAVTGLRVATLRALKPSISAPSFLELRRRLSISEQRIQPADGELVFVGRGDVRKRLVRNQDAMVAHLQAAHGVRTVFPEFLSVSEAITCFRQASQVILPVGSAKFNLAFCRPGTQVICVNPRGYSELNGGVTLMVRHMCHALGLHLHFYEVAIEPSRILLNSNLVFTLPDAEAMIRIFDSMEAG